MPLFRVPSCAPPYDVSVRLKDTLILVYQIVCVLEIKFSQGNRIKKTCKRPVYGKNGVEVAFAGNFDAIALNFSKSSGLDPLAGYPQPKLDSSVADAIRRYVTTG